MNRPFLLVGTFAAITVIMSIAFLERESAWFSKLLIINKPKLMYSNAGSFELFTDNAPSVQRQILDKYYKTWVQRYPSLLTWSPLADCDQGRYLQIDHRHSDGVGSTILFSYVPIWRIQMRWNLTLINEPLMTWIELISDGETGPTRDHFWGMHNWEIEKGDLFTCAAKSSVSTNMLEFDSLSDLYSFDESHRFFANYSHWVNNNQGFRFYIKHSKGGAGNQGRNDPVYPLNVIFTIRWKVMHSWKHSLPPPDAVDINNQVFIKKKHLQLQALGHDDDDDDDDDDEDDAKQQREPRIQMAVHIRRGDIMQNLTHAKADEYNHFIPNSYYADLLPILLEAVPYYIRKNIDVVLYSNHPLEGLMDIMTSISNAGAVPYLLSSGRAMVAWGHLLNSDILVMGRGAFSVHVAALAAAQITVGPRCLPFNRNLVLFDCPHCREHVRPADFEPSAAFFTERLTTLWNLKLKQQHVDRPLWIDFATPLYAQTMQNMRLETEKLSDNHRCLGN